MRVRGVKSQPGMKRIAITCKISAHLPGQKILACLAEGGLKFEPGMAIPHVIVNLVVEIDDWRGGPSFQPS